MIKNILKYILYLTVAAFALNYIGGCIIDSNTQSCERLADHLNATKYDWISGRGCYIDGKYYG